MGSALGVEHDSILALSSQICEYLHDFFLQTALEYLEPVRLEQKQHHNGYSPYGNAWLSATV